LRFLVRRRLAGKELPQVVAAQIRKPENRVRISAKPIPQFAAIFLLLLFTALISKRLSEGRRPPCACFGAWSAKPIGPEHLARNAALLVLAVLSLL